MRLLPVLPYAVLIFIAQAGLDTAPGVIIVREGGMGLGSAMIVAQTTQLAALVLGALAAAFMVDRARAAIAIGLGVALLAISLVVIALPPSEHAEHIPLSTLATTLGIGGAGFGLLLTPAFAKAAEADADLRPVAIALLLIAALAPRALIGVAYDAGSFGLALAAGLVVIIGLFAASTAPPRTDGPPATAAPPVGATIVGTLAVAVGTFLAVVGADPSRVSITVLGTAFGVVSLDTLAAFAAGSLVAGLALLLGGSIVLLRQAGGVGRATLAAVPALALVALAAVGANAAIAFAAPTDSVRPGERGLGVLSVTSLAASAAGIGAAAAWLVRGARALRTVAAAGALFLAVATGVAAIALAVPIPVVVESTPIMLLLVAAVGVGAGLAATALRVILAGAPIAWRGLMAAGGIVAATVGTAVGTAVGNGAGFTMLTGGAGALWIGLVILAAAAAVSFIVARMAWTSRPVTRVGSP